MENLHKTLKQVVLIILDGWGHREDTVHNAISKASTQNFDKLWSDYPHTLLDASGLAVGLPDKQMGNSEIGHTTIGAGKVIDTDLVRIKKSIETGEFERITALTTLFDHVKKHNSIFHIQGLLSDGGVHSHHEHLYVILKAAQKSGVKNIAIHIFTDGRDTAPQSAHKYIKELEETLLEIGIGKIASISGRFYAMDRDNNWDRLARTEDAMFECKGNVCKIKPSEYVENLYKENKLDEHIEPIVCMDLEGKGCAISKDDAVFFYNFRADRARMISKKIMEKQKSHNILFGTMTEYGDEYQTLTAFPSIKIETTIAKEISDAGLTQAHIAETEKFPHATYFLNGGIEKPYHKEKHIMLNSRKDIPTHDLAPKMQAKGIADKAIEEINAGTNFIFINFANPDMVGHTANVPAIIEAVEEVDLQLGRVLDALEKQGGIAFVTADHGNAEVNIDPTTGEKHTSHTINPVPAILTSKNFTLRSGGGLADIAPSILSLLNIKQPESMTGVNLLKQPH
jgi:2,3-bisphosphoglycerate-independent phosphoglycerate mutase